MLTLAAEMPVRIAHLDHEAVCDALEGLAAASVEFTLDRNAKSQRQLFD